MQENELIAALIYIGLTAAMAIWVLGWLFRAAVKALDWFGALVVAALPSFVVYTIAMAVFGSSEGAALAQAATTDVLVGGIATSMFRA